MAWPASRSRPATCWPRACASPRSASSSPASPGWLQKAGLIELDAQIGRHVPELPPEAGEPTRRQLMTHMGGTRCHLDLSLVSNALSPIPRGAPLAYHTRQRAADFAPGAQMIYCNGGYQLLSFAMERCAGTTLERIHAERIFEPLAMRDSGLVRSDLDCVPGLADLHVPRGPSTAPYICLL
ncbi:MAG TPA: serine hydrolase domain-containing protein [Nevskiaceae bacterium]|nr:serine hydrolase domain-containing protein [Nevskiaceae bacterium]